MVDFIPQEIIFRGGNPKRHVIIDLSTCPVDPDTGAVDYAAGKCVNVVEWDPVSEPDWSPPSGFIAIQDDTREITPEPPSVPPEVSNAKGRLALIGAGLFDQVDAIAEQSGKASAFYTLWNHSTIWSRSSATIANLAHQLGLTDEQVDQLFIAADRIET